MKQTIVARRSVEASLSGLEPKETEESLPFQVDVKFLLPVSTHLDGVTGGHGDRSLEGVQHFLDKSLPRPQLPRTDRPGRIESRDIQWTGPRLAGSVGEPANRRRSFRDQAFSKSLDPAGGTEIGHPEAKPPGRQVRQFLAHLEFPEPDRGTVRFTAPIGVAASPVGIGAPLVPSVLPGRAAVRKRPGARFVVVEDREDHGRSLELHRNPRTGPAIEHESWETFQLVRKLQCFVLAIQEGPLSEPRFPHFHFEIIGQFQQRLDTRRQLSLRDPFQRFALSARIVGRERIRPVCEEAERFPDAAGRAIQMKAAPSGPDSFHRFISFLEPTRPEADKVYPRIGERFDGSDRGNQGQLPGIGKEIPKSHCLFDTANSDDRPFGIAVLTNDLDDPAIVVVPLFLEV